MIDSSQIRGNRCVFVFFFFFILFMAHSICYCCYVRDKHEAVLCTLHTVILETAGNLVSIDSGAKFTLLLLSLKPVPLSLVNVRYNCTVTCKFFLVSCNSIICNLRIIRRIR